MGNSDLIIIINGESFFMAGAAYTSKFEAFNNVYQAYVKKVRQEYKVGMSTDKDNIDQFSDYWDTDLRTVEIHEISASYPKSPCKNMCKPMCIGECSHPPIIKN